MSRTKCTVKSVKASPFITTAGRPFTFLGAASISIELVRTYTDGKTEKALLTIKIRPGYKTDGASTFFPISLLVPQWVPCDDNYNAAPVAHDVLYMLGGIVDGVHEPVKLSREEVDDIFVGTWEVFYPDIVKCSEKLKSEGVNVTLHVGEELGHVYPLYPAPEGEQARKTIAEIVNRSAERMQQLVLNEKATQRIWE